MSDTAKTFDLESVHDEKISPLMDQIVAICNEYHLPMLATFLYRSDPEGIGDGEDWYCTTKVQFEDHDSSEAMERAAAIIQQGVSRKAGMRIITRGADGNIIDTVIL